MATRLVGTDSVVQRLPQGVIDASVGVNPDDLVSTEIGDARYWLQWTGTQAEYDALGVYDDNTLYVIID